MTAPQALSYVELDLATCSRVYGVAPCTAAVGVTGDAKCFNTLKTCQDSANYLATTTTLRFAEASAYRPLDIEALPIISSVSFSPGRLNPGEDLGERAVLKVSLRDMPHPDTGPGFDPYHAERGYDPYGRGTLLGKFRARQPWLRSRAQRWRLGFVGQALDEMETRHFIVESIDGPSENGVTTITAIDPLKMLDGDRSMAPAISQGRLAADIDAVTTSAALAPTGIGNAEYPASGWLNIGDKEIVAFTRSADTLTLTRAQLGTVAAEHKAQDKCQLVLRIVSQDPADIISDLAQDYAGVPADYIPLADWQTETAAFLRREYTATIAKPTPVTKLVAELMRQAGLTIWWDDLGAKIRLRVLRALTETDAHYDDSLIRNGSFSRKEQPGKRISQVWTHFAQRNPIDGAEDKTNYASVEVVADLPNESNYGSPSIKTVYSRWIAAGGRSAATRTGELLIGRFADPPRLFSFSLQRRAQPDPVLGGFATLAWRSEQDASGAPEIVPVQLVKVTPSKDSFAIEAEEMTFLASGEDLDSRQITIDADAQNLNWRTLHDALYPDPVDGDSVTCVIEAQAVVGSSSASQPSFQTGTWPTRAQSGTRSSGSAVITGLGNTADLLAGMRVTGTGIQAGSKILTVDSASQITLDKTATSSGTATVTVQTVLLTLRVDGRIQGCGGVGGTGANGNGNIDAGDGGDGGKALKADALFDLIDADGEIWGGGGGGGGGPCRDPNDHKGGGGGGGAGDSGGLGGVGPGSGREGQPGTRTAGGAGGHGWTNNNFFSGPDDDSYRRGGNGGGPGLAGANGNGSSDLDKGDGGDPGAAIDGVSKVVTVGSAGDRRGPQIN
jgi:hypothetical protein